MKIEDKVHIQLTADEVREIVKEAFKVKGVDIKSLTFNIKSVPDSDSRYSSYQFSDATGEGVRC